MGTGTIKSNVGSLSNPKSLSIRLLITGHLRLDLNRRQLLGAYTAQPLLVCMSLAIVTDHIEVDIRSEGVAASAVVCVRLHRNDGERWNRTVRNAPI